MTTIPSVLMKRNETKQNEKKKQKNPTTTKKRFCFTLFLEFIIKHSHRYFTPYSMWVSLNICHMKDPLSNTFLTYTKTKARHYFEKASIATGLRWRWEVCACVQIQPHESFHFWVNVCSFALRVVRERKRESTVEPWGIR